MSTYHGDFGGFRLVFERRDEMVFGPVSHQLDDLDG